MLEIVVVEPGSIAEELDLSPGDCLLAINGFQIRDLVDYQLFEGQEDLLLEVQKPSGEIWELEFDKDADEPLGILFDPPEPTQCGNNCIFCFVHQLPPRMRRTLYVKDEDYRFSYLYGTYVTLTNLREADLERIIEQKLSPLYVSVHATDPQLRNRLLGKETAPILPLLHRVVAAGIEVHTQIVVCPGVNDGEYLRKSIGDLFALHPGVKTLAVVPVGLTGHREHLEELRPPTREEAQQTLAMIASIQSDFLSKAGTRFVFAADEYYLKAEEDFPPLGNYETLAQIENGVGLIPQFRAEAEQTLREAKPLSLKTVSTVTGESAHEELNRFVSALGDRTGVAIRLYPIRNEFFGGHVSVTGLLTGRDVIQQLQGQVLGAALLVPNIMLKDDEDLFLDDCSLDDVEKALGVPVLKIPSTPWGLLDGLEFLAQHSMPG